MDDMITNALIAAAITALFYLSWHMAMRATGERW
jgi:hypothetical protein